jgi:hypothetical protein
VAVKPGDAVIAPRYVGPPLEDATALELGEERQRAMTGEGEVIRGLLLAVRA